MSLPVSSVTLLGCAGWQSHDRGVAAATGVMGLVAGIDVTVCCGPPVAYGVVAVRGAAELDRAEGAPVVEFAYADGHTRMPSGVVVGLDVLVFTAGDAVGGVVVGVLFFATVVAGTGVSVIGVVITGVGVALLVTGVGVVLFTTVGAGAGVGVFTTVAAGAGVRVLAAA